MRFGLIGAGHIGRVRAKAFRGLHNCELVAIADVERGRAQSIALFRETRIFDQYSDLLKMDDLDAVVVSTPPQLHEEIVLSALRAGKHVLCEKPLGTSVLSCRRMVDMSKKMGRTLATGFNHRYFPAIQFVKEALDTGLIGELDHVRAFAGHTGLSEFEAPWMYDKNIIGGGSLMDNGIHIIDLTRYLLGEIVEVFGFVTSDVWNLNGCEDNAVALLRNPLGKHAVLQATWSEWKGYRFYIEAYGNKGMVRASYAPMMSMAIYMDRPGGRRRRRVNLYPMNIIRERLYGWESTAEMAFCREISDFVRLCEGRECSIADGFCGLRAVEIANAIYHSHEKRKPIFLPAPSLGKEGQVNAVPSGSDAQ